MWTQTKWCRALWLTNDKASYVAKEDSICLLSVAKEATLNEQWIKPCVPLYRFYYPHWLRELVSPVCGIFMENMRWSYDSLYSLVRWWGGFFLYHPFSSGILVFSSSSFSVSPRFILFIYPFLPVYSTNLTPGVRHWLPWPCFFVFHFFHFRGLLQFLRNSKSWRTSKSHNWFKSYDNFAEKKEFFLLDTEVKLVGGGSVINGAYPV
jgi:hypothetical protein